MMRIFFAIAVLAHGLGHSLFLANTWGLWKNLDHHAGLFAGTSQTVEGLVGLLWILPLLGFVAFAWQMIKEEEWRPRLVLGSVLLSGALIIVWWGSINAGNAIFALMFDVVLAAALFLHRLGDVATE